ncbi:MAG TPA: hypothetical protein DCY40_00005, partial [Actinobacteria bacterium]|nr:hypothetical protein [Actinomycetota bacterium]
VRRPTALWSAFLLVATSLASLLVAVPAAWAASSVDRAEVCVASDGTFRFSVDFTATAVAEIVFRVNADDGPFPPVLERFAVNFDSETGTTSAAQPPEVETFLSPPFDRWVDGPVEDYTATSIGPDRWRVEGGLAPGTQPFTVGDTVWGVVVRAFDGDAVMQDLVVGPCAGSVFVVDNTGDTADFSPGDGLCDTGEDADNTCTLRAAIQEANAGVGADTIRFAFDGTAPHVITPTKDLPPLGYFTVVDATTEPDYLDTPVVELSGTAAGDAGSALSIVGPGVVVRGLSITGWPGNAISISSGGSDARVEFNHVGVNPSGSVAGPNGGQGISVFGEDGATIRDNLVSANTIGILLQGATNSTISGNTVGTDLAGNAAIPNGLFGITVEAGGEASSANTLIDGNLVSGNPGYGIGVAGGSTNTTITNNRVGTNQAGTAAVPNGTGVSLNGSGSFAEIGPGNLISGNRGNGISVSSPTAIDVFIEGNQIGTDAEGGALGNGGAGVSADGSDLWIGSVFANEIAFNTGAGISLSSNVASSLIRNNSIHDNGGLGIDYVEPAPLAPPTIDAVSTGDGDDMETGPFVDVTGTISQPLTDFTIAVFANSECDPSGFGEGERFLGAADVTNVDETTEFSVRVDAVLAPGEVVTALLSVPQGFTSEFSECVDEAVPVVVDTLEVTVNLAETGPGATSVNLIDIPIEAVFGAAQGSSASASPLGAVPLGAVDLGDSPLGAIPLGAVPLGAVPLGSVPLGAVTVDYPGGWSALLAGTPFDGRPLQTILLSEVTAYAADNPGSDLASVTIARVSLDATPLGAVSLLSLALGALPLGAVPLGAVGTGCDAATDQGFVCDPGTTTLLELELSGFDVAASPLGAVPLGAVPLGSVPLGAVRLDAVPLGAVPLGAVPLGAVDLAGTPLGAVPLGAVDLAGTPLGAVPLGAVGGCGLLSGFAFTCVSLGATGDTSLYELAVLLETAGSSLAASPLGAVPLGAVPLG